MKFKSFRKGVLAMALAASLLFSTCATGIQISAQDVAFTVYGMQVNDLENPLGIDSEKPTFGWKLRSDIIGEMQTAYQITVATDEKMSDKVWDSGTVNSSDTSAIVYAGTALADCTRYYWNVCVTDNNGVSVTSETAWFETAFIDGSLTDSAKWLEVTDSIVGGDDTEITVDYAIDVDIIDITKAASLLFGTSIRTNGKTAMWQIQDKGTYFQLVPHYYNVGWKTTGTSVKLTSDSEAYEAMADGFHLQIKVSDSGVKTYIDNKLVATHLAKDIAFEPSLGFVGLRVATDEGIVIDNLTVTDYLNNANGVVLAALDFADEDDGTLHAESKLTTNNWYGEKVFISGLTAAAKRTTDYTIELDVLSVEGAVGFLFGKTSATDGSALMWQIQNKSTYFQLVPHYFDSSTRWLWCNVSGTTVRFANDTDSYNNIIANGFKLKLHITDSYVKTYIDGELISTVTASQLGYSPSLGFVGVRCATNEYGSIDNLKVTDYMANTDGDVLASFDFSEKPSDMTGEYSIVENGIFTMTEGKYFGIDYFVKGLKSKAADTVIPVVRKVHYTYEADITCSSLAASLCFNMKDTSNFLMWQFGLVSDDTKVELKPHQVINGKYTAISKIDITDFISAEKLKTGVNIKLEITDTAILTYADGKLINTFDISLLSLELFCGKFGFRVATNEDFTLDNVKAVNYFESADDGVLFNHTFDTVNPFYRGKLQDGKLVLDSSNDMGVSIIHNGTATFRKEFTAEKTVKKARLYIGSYGVFNAYLNGERIGNKNADDKTVYDELAPGWTDSNYRTCYYTYDITDYLSSGTNTLAVGVHYGWTGIKLYYSNEPSTPHKLLAQMVITYTDGSSEVIGTDSSWKSATTGPVLLADIFQGEYYDATADTSYRLNGYDTSKWENAKEVTFNTTLASRAGGQIYLRDDLERAVQSVTVYDGITDTIADKQYGKINITATYGDEEFTLKAGETAVVDFGQNSAGWENITLDGTAGTYVTIRHAEMLNDNMGLISRGNDGPEGSIYIANLRNAPARTVYVMTDGVQNYRPTATYYGFRYIEITVTADITVKKVRGEVATSITSESGTFESSDSLLNQLYSNIKWGQYSNYFGQATDCPQRDERLGYSGDAQVFALTAMYNSDVKAFMQNFMQTLVEGQADDGGFGNTMPGKAESGSVWSGVAGWADAGIIVPHTYYKQYGDKEFLKKYYDAMVKYMDYLANMGAERTGQKFGDWLSYEDNIINYISYVYTIWDAQMMQEIAETLGNSEDVEKFAKMEETYLGYFREKYLNENGDLTTTTQTAYLFALKLGLYETEDAYERGKEALVKKIKNNGNRLTTGFLGTSIIMETLVEIGETDLAYELLFQEESPSWLYEVKQGATTVWERWNSYSKTDGFGPVSMNSFNHYAYGSVGDYLYNTVLGINPDDAGYKTVLLSPVPTDKLSYAKGSYDSENGLIESSWTQNENGKFSYGFTVPMNTTATVKLEKQAYSTYYVNGIRFDRLTDESGVVYVGQENGYEIFTVTSGSFKFTVTTAPQLTAATVDSPETFTFDVTGLAEYNNNYTASGKGYYTFGEDEETIVKTLNEKFNFYYDREGTYNSRDIFESGDTADKWGGNSVTNISSRWILLYNDFLQRFTNKTSGEIFRKIDSLVPKNSLGKEIQIKNFETSYDIRFEKSNVGAVILGFRQQTPGRFTGGYYNLLQSQGFVAIGQNGITVAAGTDIKSGNNLNGDMYNKFKTSFEAQLPQEVTVKVRVVGSNCTVQILNRTTKEILYTFNEEVPYDAVGSISYAVSTVGHDIGNIELKALDDNGNICDISTPYNTDEDVMVYRRGSIKISDVTESDSGFVYTLNVTPEKGWFMKSASLTVTGSDGKTAVAQEIENDIFKVTTNGGTVNAEFYEIGDLNYDNSVDILDLIRIKKVLTQTTSETSDSDADCNEDGILDVKDLQTLRKFLLTNN